MPGLVGLPHFLPIIYICNSKRLSCFIKHITFRQLRSLCGHRFPRQILHSQQFCMTQSSIRIRNEHGGKTIVKCANVQTKTQKKSIFLNLCALVLHVCVQDQNIYRLCFLLHSIFYLHFIFNKFISAKEKKIKHSVERRVKLADFTSQFSLLFLSVSHFLHTQKRKKNENNNNAKYCFILFSINTTNSSYTD